MRNVPAPPVDARSAYNEIARSRGDVGVRRRLKLARGAVFSAYEDYSLARADVTTLMAANTDPATRKDLTGNYNSNCKATTDLKSAILANNAGGKCPLCLVSSGTLDHYLPKQSFPEFSVFPPNLIPACWTCNHRKASRYRDADAIFLHAYFDVIPPDTRFLFAQVDITAGGPVFDFWVDPPAVLGSLQNRVRTHFDELGLAETYMLEAIEEYSAHRENLVREHEAADGDINAVRSYLAKVAQSTRSGLGVNHWRYAALDAMASSDDFCAGAFLE